MCYDNNVFTELRNHSYAFCVKPIDEMVDVKNVKANSLGFALTEKYVAGTINYIKGLVIDGSIATSVQCGNAIGEKYILNTGGKCNYNGKTVNRYKYINNMDCSTFLSGGRSETDPGYVPCAIAAAQKINGLGILNSFIENTVPNCSAVKLKTHTVKIIDSKTASSVDLDSPLVYIASDELNGIDNANIVCGAGDKPSCSKQGFQNLYENLNSFMNINNINNINNMNNMNNMNIYNDENDIIIDIYYILLSLFITFLIFKMTIAR